MRKSLAILFLAVYALSFTEVHQALKVPILFKHYQEHSSAVEMTFIQFLVMHYETDIPHDDTDMRLPFKTCDRSLNLTVFAVVNPKTSLKEAPFVSKTKHESFYQPISPSSLAHDIFQPPKFS